jgi:cytochrome P450
MELFGSMWRNIKTDTKAGKAKPCLGADMANAYEKEGVSEDVAAYTCGSVLEAGADTTSNTLYGFIQAMILFPEVQRKVQQCLDEVVGSNRLPGMEDYPNLPYIRSCVKESTRWLPTAILGFPHAVMEEDVYKGYRIPKGAGVITNVYTLHNDPEKFADPKRFDPERFKDDEESLFYTATSPENRGTFTFGAGRRSCQGLHIAERSLFLAISRVLWAFDILPAKDADGKDVIPDPSKLTQGFVCMPEPYKATIRPRSAERAALVRKYWEEAQADLDPDSKEWR